MKVTLFLSLLLMLGFYTGQAQNAYQAENEGWLVKLDEAYAQSKKSGKPILANFTGSDWCVWCKRLTADVFSKPEFKKWADKNVILLELDFPRRKQLPEDIRQQNFNLQQGFNVRGYPTIWVFNLDKDTKTGNYNIDPLGNSGYRKSVDEFTGEIDEFIKAKKKGK